jgi:hypothetical protein
MSTHEQNLRTDGSVATEGGYGRGDALDETDDFGSDTFGESGEVSVERGGPDLLFGPEDRLRFGERWNDIQTRFVDDPRDAVESADELVAEMMGRMADRLAEHRSLLGEELAGEDDVETEDLRLATQRYRAFFHRLLST